MLRSIINGVRGVAALLVIAISTLVLCLLIYALALGKLIAPDGPLRQWFRAAISTVAELWIGVNNSLLSALPRPHWDLDLPTTLDRKGCYLVVCNHQSWVDIIALQKCFNRRLPLLRFFLKKQLIWVPFLGVAWWALDFPFMHRASRAEIERKPELRGADLESARQACEKFSTVPVAMMSFPEGTRFSQSKRLRTQSAYQHLLLPKAGGVGQVLFALGEQLDACLDVTIVYPGRDVGAGAPSFWELLSGQLDRIVVRARYCEIPSDLAGTDSRNDPDKRAQLQSWLTDLWQQKDAAINDILGR